MPDVMVLLVVLAVAAVLFLAAVVATQEGDYLVDAPPDRPDVELPTGRVVAEDLRAVRFGMVFRGYRMSEVDEVLERLGDELAERDERILDLEQALVEVVEPAVREAEARQAGATAGLPAPPGDPAELTATEDAFAPEAEVPEEPRPVMSPLEWVASYGVTRPAEPRPVAAEPEPEPVEEPEPAPEPEVAREAPSPLDPAWVPPTVAQTLDLASSYRLSMPAPSAPPEPTPEPEEPVAVVPPGAEAPTEDELDFPEVEPADPAPGWVRDEPREQ